MRNLFSAIITSVLVILALTSRAWTKKLFGRGEEKPTQLSQPFLDHLNSLVGGQEDQIMAIIDGENISEVLTMVQHLELPIDVRRECNKIFLKCMVDLNGGRIKAFIWMRQNVEQETVKQVLDDVDSSSTCKEELVKWTKAKVTSRCCKSQGQSQRKYISSQIN